MKRNMISLLLFIALIVWSSANLVILGKATSRFTEAITEYGRAYEENGAPAEESLSEFTSAWESYYKTASFLTRSQMLDEMAASVAELAEGGDASPEGTLNSLRYRAELIYDEQLPHFSSVF